MQDDSTVKGSCCFHGRLEAKFSSASCSSHICDRNNEQGSRFMSISSMLASTLRYASVRARPGPCCHSTLSPPPGADPPRRAPMTLPARRTWTGHLQQIGHRRSESRKEIPNPWPIEATPHNAAWIEEATAYLEEQGINEKSKIIELTPSQQWYTCWRQI